MFSSSNNHLLHKNAVKLVMAQLPGAMDMDAVEGYYAPYDVEWRNIKLLVKVAKRSKKSSQKSAKWFYRLRDKNHEVADYFILFAIVHDEVGAVYVLPRVCSPLVYITISKLDGNMRYDYFKTDLNRLPEKILKVQSDLPKIVKLRRKVGTLRGGG